MRDGIFTYGSGKMTGLKDYNYSAFIDTTADIRDLTGCHIVHTACMPRGLKWQDYIDISLQLVRICKAVAVLPGSDNSKGVELELAEAEGRNMPVFYLPDELSDFLFWVQDKERMGPAYD